MMMMMMMIWYEYDNNNDALHKLNFLLLVKWFCAYFSNHILFILYLLFVFTFLGYWVGFGGWWKQVWKPAKTKHMPTPAQWTDKNNPTYSYYIYYCYANLYTLNKVCNFFSRQLYTRKLTHQWNQRCDIIHVSIKSVTLYSIHCLLLSSINNFSSSQLHYPSAAMEIELMRFMWDCPKFSLSVRFLTCLKGKHILTLSLL